MKEQYLPRIQQESILTLLCFDVDFAGVIVGLVDVELFDSAIYREIATHAVAFYNEYKEPIAEHLPDALATILEGEDEKKADLYDRTLRNLYESKGSIKKEYILHRLDVFVSDQRFKKALVESAKEMQKGDTAEAKSIINRSLKQKVSGLEVGRSLADKKQVQVVLETSDVIHPVGIKDLDKIRFGPSPKTLMTFMAAARRGKSWFLIAVGRYCAQHRLKVVHVTLEMSEVKVYKRYMQNVLAISKRTSEVQYNKLLFDRRGTFNGLSLQKVMRPTFSDREIESVIENKLDKLKLPLVIKEFPTNGLTVSGLEAYLDQLERFENFIPDVVLIDYADLMSIDSKRQREETSQVYKDLRGIAVDRELAIVTASQSNRLGEDAKTITLKHLAEDYTKAATSDMILTYSQTKQEKKNGLARLWVAKNRDDEDDQTYIITQAYMMGQFVMDCSRVPSGYWDFIRELED